MMLSIRIIKILSLLILPWSILQNSCCKIFYRKLFTAISFAPNGNVQKPESIACRWLRYRYQRSQHTTVHGWNSPVQSSHLAADAWRGLDPIETGMMIGCLDLRDLTPRYDRECTLFFLDPRRIGRLMAIPTLCRAEFLRSSWEVPAGIKDDFWWP